jgi:two-component system, NtrC family, response regulator AtoC
MSNQSAAKPRGTVLLVDDDPAITKILSAQLGQVGIAAVEAHTAELALTLLDSRPIDVVVSDVRMPGMDGMALCARISLAWPEIPVVILTAHGSIQVAVEAMKAGAVDFMQKPFERDEVLFVIEKALTAAARDRERTPPRTGLTLIGQSASMSAMRETIRRSASGNATVLIRGETGTGKELVARAVHEHSLRRDKPFVKLNCASLPDSLLESELFGYEKGAFTGAFSRKPGRVELAQRGTLFLDEIGDVPLATQVKLLRILQERELERLGGTETIKVDVRFVAATHRDLESMVADGKFREDLFYRLNVLPLDVPPLRERSSDIAALVQHFTHAASAANGRGDTSVDSSALELLQAQAWPGNVRQLENFVERLIVLSDGPVVRQKDVLRELAKEGGRARSGSTTPETPVSVRGLGSQRRDAERQAVTDALVRAGNNKSLAARLLGVSRRTLYNKLEELGLEPQAN